MSLIIDLGYLLAAIFMLPWLIYRALARGDWRSILFRCGLILPPPATASIWLHGSSAGEILLLQPLVRRIEKDFPNSPIVVSAYSSTGFTTAKQAFPKHRVFFFPLDISFVVRRFLCWFDPKLVVLIESDFWPNFLLAAKAKNIPIAVLNGKISERSYQLHSKTRIVPMLLRHLPIFAVQNEQYASRLSRLGISSECIHVTGNMKYDLVSPISSNLVLSEHRVTLNYSNTDLVIIGGSLHGQENNVLIKAFESLKKNNKNIALIIVPRYPMDALQINESLKEKGKLSVLKTEVDSARLEAPGSEGILVVDTVGQLRSLYAIADIAFVGGSLFYRGKRKGGHNLMEPASLGVPVIFGPHNFSFKDTVDALLEAKGGVQVSNEIELKKTLKELLNDKNSRLKMGKFAKEVILKSKGATDQNYKLLFPFLNIARKKPGPIHFKVWSIVIYLLAPFALLFLLWRGMRYPAYWYRWSERFGYVLPMKHEKTFWVHAVSVGEVRSVSELVSSLAEKYPSYRILVTTATPTGSNQVQELFGDRVSHSYVPYDLPLSVRRFMDRVNPDFVVVAETEFWPNLFGECRRREIPLLLVNVRLSQTSIRGYNRVPMTSHAMFENADVLCTQTEGDARELENLGVAKHLIHVTGNLKFDMPVTELLVQEGQNLRERWGNNRLVVIAASTHRGEEKIVLDAFSRLRRQYPEILLVIVPRHPERFSAVAKLCKRAGYNVLCHSSYKGKLTPNVDVLVGDTMGELQKFYVASDVAVIGGSFVPIGGHNLLEACAVAVPVIFGPHMFHLSEISTMVVERGAGCQVCDTDSLVEAVSDYLENPLSRVKASDAAHRLVAENSGSLQRTLKIIEKTLESRHVTDSNVQLQNK